MKDVFTDLSPWYITGKTKDSFWNPQEQNLVGFFYFILLLAKMLMSSVKKQSCFGWPKVDRFCFLSMSFAFLLLLPFFSLILWRHYWLWAGSWLVFSLKSKRKPTVLKVEKQELFPPACSQPLGVLDSVCAEVLPPPCTVKQLQGFKQLQMHPLNVHAPTSQTVTWGKYSPFWLNLEFKFVRKRYKRRAPTEGKKKCFSHRQWTQVTTDLPAVCIQRYYVAFNVIRCKEQADGSTVKRLATQPKRSKVGGEKKAVFRPLN